MRIAVIHFKFDQRLNYAENVYATALVRLGHEVTVFTSSHGFEDWSEKELENFDNAQNYQIVRCRKFWVNQSVVIPYGREVPDAIQEFRPDIAIMLAPHHGPAIFWLSSLPKQCRLISGFSDLPWHRRNLLVWRFVKKPWIAKVLRRSHLVLGMTQETVVFFDQQFSGVDFPPMRMCGLFYDSAIYDCHFEGEPEGGIFKKFIKVVTLVTKSLKYKNIEVILECIRKLLLKEDHVGFVFAGITDDLYGNELRDLIIKSYPVGRYELHPILPGEKVRSLCCLSHLTIWPLVSIGIQQSMACGCPALVKKSMPTEHFLQPGVNGELFNDDCSNLLEKLLTCCRHEWSRDQIKDSVKIYSSDRAIADLVSEVIR